jgi:hypothetical protein
MFLIDFLAVPGLAQKPEKRGKRHPQNLPFTISLLVSVAIARYGAAYVL